MIPHQSHDAIAKSAQSAKTEGLGPQDAGTVPERQSPTLSLINHIITNQERRHADIIRAGEQIREMNRREQQEQDDEQAS